MKIHRLLPTLALSFAATFAFAAEKSASTPAPAATAPKQSQSERRAAALLKELKLTDARQEARTRAILESHLDAMEKWHAANDPTLTPLWAEWSAERNKPKRGDAVKVADKIDAVYASFRPQRDAFLVALAREITPAQIETIKNSLTRSPGMDRTANAYIEMGTPFTEADKAFVRERFRIAREQAIDTTTGKEVDAFFKRQKDIVETYIDEKGYDYQKLRKVWTDKLKVAEDAAKAAKANAKKQ